MRAVHACWTSRSRELAGKTRGIVGSASWDAGSRASRRPSGCPVLIAQRPGGPPQEGACPLDELLARSDVVTLHVPLADNTRGLIGAARARADEVRRAADRHGARRNRRRGGAGRGAAAADG